MKYLIFGFFLATICTLAFSADSMKDCGAPDLEKLAGYYTAPDGSFVTIEYLPENTVLRTGQAKVSELSAPKGMMAVVTTLCGGTSSCSTKTCSSGSCKNYARGCSCQ